MAPQISCPYSPETLAHDALAAAGHIVRGIDPSMAYDPLRAALAEQHAQLLRGIHPGDMPRVMAAIVRALPSTLPAAQEQVRQDQQLLS